MIAHLHYKNIVIIIIFTPRIRNLSKRPAPVYPSFLKGPADQGPFGRCTARVKKTVCCHLTRLVILYASTDHFARHNAPRLVRNIAGLTTASGLPPNGPLELSA